MPPRQRNRVVATPLSSGSHGQPTATAAVELPITPPRLRRNRTRDNTTTTIPAVNSQSTPAAPPRRGRKRGSEHSVPTMPAQKRRRTPTATATLGSITEPTSTVITPSQQSDILNNPSVPSVDAIADAVFSRMRDAGILPDNEPHPEPTPVTAQASTLEPQLITTEKPTNAGSHSTDMGMTHFIDPGLIMPQCTNQTLISQTLPLGYNVPDKTKQLIWGDQYVDLSQLPPGTQQTSETVLYQSPDSSLKIATGIKPTKNLSSIHQWNNCFDIYMSIYLTKFNDRVLQLVKYANSIRNMSARLGFEAARFYDKEFRKLKSSHGLHWSVIHDELWRVASNMQSRGNTNVKTRVKLPFRRDSQPEFKPGFCWRFCRTGQCHAKSCTLRHACCICGKRHATGACRKAQKQTTNTG